MEVTSYSTDLMLFWSMFNFPIVSPISDDISSRIGETVLHGPHHSAQKSIRIKSLSFKAWSKLLSFISISELYKISPALSIANILYNRYMIDYQPYNELKAKHKISNEDFKVCVADDVLTKDLIDYVYNNLKEDSVTMQDWGGRKSYSMPLNPLLARRINEVAKATTGLDIYLKEFFFLRYTLDYGYEPKLFPHWDSRESQRITFDIQMNADEEWGVVVEGDNYRLKFNQGLLFSGTQQIHWRENIKLSPGTVVDMLICNMAYTKDIPLDEGQAEILEERSMFLMEETGIGNKAIEA